MHKIRLEKFDRCSARAKNQKTRINTPAELKAKFVGSMKWDEKVTCACQIKVSLSVGSAFWCTDCTNESALKVNNRRSRPKSARCLEKCLETCETTPLSEHLLPDPHIIIVLKAPDRERDR